jgi:serine/threonine-protein kinase RIO1
MNLQFVMKNEASGTSFLQHVIFVMNRDRERYVQGDFRFRHGYSKHNPRKMVKTWAEKEMRNLNRYLVLPTVQFLGLSA